MYIFRFFTLTLGCKSNMLVVTWLGGLTWLILVSADDVVAASASASAVAFVSPVIRVGSEGLPVASSASVFTLFNLLPSFLADDILCESLAEISAPAKENCGKCGKFLNKIVAFTRSRHA